MSVKHPVIAITGSSGAGTSTVMQSFKHVFRREALNAQIVEGDSFHRYDRMSMRARMKEEAEAGNNNFSHFGPEANLLAELEALFVTTAATARARCASTCMMPARRSLTARSRGPSSLGKTSPPGPT